MNLRKQSPRYQNPNCDGAHCEIETGEVRIYPLPGGANLILCHDCFDHERVRELLRSKDAQHQLAVPLWINAKPYAHTL